MVRGSNAGNPFQLKIRLNLQSVHRYLNLTHKLGIGIDLIGYNNFLFQVL